MGYNNPFMSNPYGSLYGQGYYPAQQAFPAPQNAQQQAQVQTPRSSIPFATEDEIRAYVLMPNTQILALDKEKPIMYIKTADAVGRSMVEVYEYKKIVPSDTAKSADTSAYITREELGAYATKQDISDLRAMIERSCEVTE